MNITIDTQFSTSGAGSNESATTTYKTTTSSQGAGNVSKSGYILDIADKVMDNEAYKGHGLTADEIMQQAANTNVNAQKDFMIVMSNCVSGEDLQKMQEEGFNPGSTDVETYVNIVDKIKVTLAQAGVEVTGYNDDLDVEIIEQITGSRTDANALIKELSDALQKSDIPVTNENVSELVKAIMEASDITGLSEDAIKYLVVNHKEPTIENVYKAQYSTTDNIRQSQGYYSEGSGYFSKYMSQKADNINWENLESAIESVVIQAGLDTDKNTKALAIDNAKWLISSGIELNTENLTKVTELKNLSLPMEQEDVTRMCVTAMENGKSPMKADITGEVSIAQKAHDIAEAVVEISDEAVHEVAVSGTDINIKNLSAAQRLIDERQTDNVSGESEASLKEIEARRQLEEIRLMMSEEANRHLLKAGISIDTTELSKLVDALKSAEASLKSALFQGENEAENEQRALIYEETLTKTKELADMPASLLGKLKSDLRSYTLLKLHEEGSHFQNQNEGQNPSRNDRNKSAEAYETLMTQPRKDLGDKISKAFRNIDDILDDMSIEANETNRRAVRILGYNNMEITFENINAVKQADSLVSGVIKKMTPATTLQMIREQKNPLEMTMDELESYLNGKAQEPVEDAEKYSKFLQRLDRAGSIGEDEREAYIGIYRMFRQIEKSDGAVIGSIVASGAEMNFKNMLSAVRTAANKNMDIHIDDGFGALENLISKGKAIDEQINGGYHHNTDNEPQSRDTKEQEKYYAGLSGDINSELANRTDLNKINSMNITEQTTIEQFADDIKMTQMSENALSEEKAENLKNFRQNMQQVEQIDEKIIDTLIDFGQPVSVDNIQAAAMLIFDRGSLFKQIAGKNDNTSNDEQAEDILQGNDAEDAILEQADKFIESLNNAEQAKSSYSDIIAEANKSVENMVYSNGTSNIDVKAAKALYKGLSLAGNLAREENYEVPMNIKGEITSVNLKIYHNASQTGKVAVTLDTDKLGKVAAEFDVTANRISAMVVYDTKSEKADMEILQNKIKTELEADSEKQVTISLVNSNEIDLEKFGGDRNITKDNDKLSTAELYQTAKAFLTALKEV